MLSATCQHVLAAEMQKGIAEGRDFVINLQRGKLASKTESDKAPEKLFGSSPSYVRRRFEQLFAGKGQGGDTSGVHNWLHFQSLEHSGKLDYRGYIYPKPRAGGEVIVASSDLIVNVEFNFEGQSTEVSSVWLGTSPEFELALYTLCFIAGEATNVLELSTPTATYGVEIRCEHISGEDGDKIGGVVPKLLFKETKSEIQSQHQPQPPTQQPPPVSRPLVQQPRPPQRPQARRQARPPHTIRRPKPPPGFFDPAQPAPSPDCCECLAALFGIDASSTRRTGKKSRFSCWGRNVAVIDDSSAFRGVACDGSRGNFDVGARRPVAHRPR